MVRLLAPVNRRTVAVVALLATLAAMLAVWPFRPAGTPASVQPLLIAVAWVTFALAAWLVLRLDQRRAVPLIIAGAIVLPVVAGLGPPRSSDDLYRYVWDGRVQAAGIDPYRFAPAAPDLVGLRDDDLWPTRSAWCVPAGAVDEATGEPMRPGCTLINRPWVHTIYPPAAQWIFRAVEAASPTRAPIHVPMQVAAGLLAVATTMLLVVGLRRRGADPRRAALWAWCPLVAIEAGSNAHIDVAAAGLTAAGLLVVASPAAARSTRHAAVGGALLGLAVATKLTPVLVLPAVMRCRALVVLPSAFAALAAVYLPHLVAVGASVLGYLPGYLREEGYASATRFALLTWLVPDAWRRPWPRSCSRPWRSSRLDTGRRSSRGRAQPSVVGGTGGDQPGLPWYALLLVILVALGARPAWLGVAAAGYLAQYAAELGSARAPPASSATAPPSWSWWCRGGPASGRGRGPSHRPTRPYERAFARHDRAPRIRSARNSCSASFALRASAAR